MLTAVEITANIHALLGTDEHGLYKGIRPHFEVAKMYKSVGRHRREFSGRFQVKVESPTHTGRPTIARTTLDGRLDYDKIVAAIRQAVEVRLAAIARDNLKKSNESVVEEVKNSYTGTRHVSDWSGSACAVIASSTREEEVVVKWSFPSMKADKAKRVLEFISMMEAEGE